MASPQDIADMEDVIEVYPSIQDGSPKVRSQSTPPTRSQQAQLRQSVDQRQQPLTEDMKAITFLRSYDPKNRPSPTKSTITRGTVAVELMKSRLQAITKRRGEEQEQHAKQAQSLAMLATNSLMTLKAKVREVEEEAKALVEIRKLIKYTYEHQPVDAAVRDGRDMILCMEQIAAGNIRRNAADRLMQWYDEVEATNLVPSVDDVMGLGSFDEKQIFSGCRLKPEADAEGGRHQVTAERNVVEENVEGADVEEQNDEAQDDEAQDDEEPDDEEQYVDFGMLD